MLHQPRKRFGQNFLTDHTIIQQIMGSIAIQPGQHWIEIGPGLGALTEPLLDSGVTLDVVELDRNLVKHLQHNFQHQTHLHIHSGDALNFDFGCLAYPGESLHFIGNLPYNISSPIIFHLLESINCIEDMHFMLQKEVVDRICAAPGSKKYGRLSVMVQYHCATEKLFEVSAESFDPPPKVLSAMIKLTPHKLPPVAITNLNDLSYIVSKAFSQRRKTLRNALKNILTEREIVDLGIDPACRAETLTLKAFAKLSNSYSANQT
jgi:16S rRNA (adenine1518-N6/adenine1519-N6)-dimethyltransferase